MKKKSSNPINQEEKISYLEGVLTAQGCLDGLDAFTELCDIGRQRCGESFQKNLAERLLFYGDKDKIRINLSSQGKGIQEISIRPLDSFEEALKPFPASSSRDLKPIVDKVKKLLEDIELLRQSAFVQELIEQNLLTHWDLLAGLPVYTGYFQGLLNLQKHAKILSPRASQNIRLTKIQEYIKTCTGRDYDELLATILNQLPIHKDKPITADALRIRRSRRNKKSSG